MSEPRTEALKTAWLENGCAWLRRPVSRRLDQRPVAMLELLARAARAGGVAPGVLPAFRQRGDRQGLALFGVQAVRQEAHGRRVLAGQGIEVDLLELARRRQRRLLELELDRHQPSRDVLAKVDQQALEEREGLGLVLVQRVALAVAAQADDVPEVVQVHQVLAP